MRFAFLPTETRSCILHIRDSTIIVVVQYLGGDGGGGGFCIVGYALSRVIHHIQSEIIFHGNPKWLIIKLFPARESFVSDIPARDGKIANLFYSLPSLLLYKQVL